jgi:hypothetical protein
MMKKKRLKSTCTCGATLKEELGLVYKLADTPPPSPELLLRVLGQFRDAGCNARQSTDGIVFGLDDSLRSCRRGDQSMDWRKALWTK